MALGAEWIAGPALHERAPVLGPAFSHQLFADTVAGEAVAPFKGLVHLHHRRILAVAFLTLEGAGRHGSQEQGTDQGNQYAAPVMDFSRFIIHDVSSGSL